MNSLDQAVNLKVKVTTLLDQPAVGYIYAYLPVHEILALRVASRRSPDAARPDSYRLINTAFIKTIQVLPPFPRRAHSADLDLSKSPSPTAALPHMAPLSINELETNLNRAVAQYKQMVSASHNPSASPTAVMLFEKLYAQFGSVRWDGDEIVVEDAVRVTKPYLAKAGTVSKNDDAPELSKRVYLAVKDFWHTIEAEKNGG